MMWRSGSYLKAYRTGAGVAAVGAGPEPRTTTGCFAQALNPTSNAITISTNIVVFGMCGLLAFNGL
jgi:hypothetical protein